VSPLGSSNITDCFCPVTPRLPVLAGARHRCSSDRPVTSLEGPSLPSRQRRASSVSHLARRILWIFWMYTERNLPFPHPKSPNLHAGRTRWREWGGVQPLPRSVLQELGRGEGVQTLHCGREPDSPGEHQVLLQHGDSPVSVCHPRILQSHRRRF
jgi:hypothetical protein